MLIADILSRDQKFTNNNPNKFDDTIAGLTETEIQEIDHLDYVYGIANSTIDKIRLTTENDEQL